MDCQQAVTIGAVGRADVPGGVVVVVGGVQRVLIFFPPTPTHISLREVDLAHEMSAKERCYIFSAVGTSHGVRLKEIFCCFFVSCVIFVQHKSVLSRVQRLCGLAESMTHSRECARTNDLLQLAGRVVWFVVML